MRPVESLIWSASLFKSLFDINIFTLLEKAKLAREISDGKNEIPHKFFGRKI